MLFVIHGFDADNVQAKRQDKYNDHKNFLANAEKYGVSIVMSGPLAEDDGVTPKGSLFVIEAPDRTTAEEFHRNDPFYSAGIWKETTITAFIRRR